MWKLTARKIHALCHAQNIWHVTCRHVCHTAYSSRARLGKHQSCTNQPKLWWEIFPSNKIRLGNVSNVYIFIVTQSETLSKDVAQYRSIICRYIWQHQKLRRMVRKVKKTKNAWERHLRFQIVHRCEWEDKCLSAFSIGVLWLAGGQSKYVPYLSSSVYVFLRLLHLPPAIQKQSC